MVRLFRFLLGFACLALSAPIMAADSNISDLERNALLQARLAQYIISLSAEDGGFRYLDRQESGFLHLAHACAFCLCQNSDNTAIFCALPCVMRLAGICA